MTGRRHLPALDGLRGVAVSGVLLFHTDRLPGGFLGVDLFFVLSGFLITSQLLDRGVRLVEFWGRRVRRLAPALAVMVGTVTVVVWATAEPDMVRTTLGDGPWVQANLVNWHLIAESAGYWDRFGPGRVFEHLWSIAVEEQFYLVWPLVVLVAGAGRRVGVIAAVGSAASLITMITLLGPGDPTRVYIGTDTRAFSLLLGALAATAGARRALDAIPDRWTGAILTALVLVLGAAWALIDGVQWPWLFTHSLASAALIGLCARGPRTVVTHVLSREPLRWLGSISYSLYLWHWPVIVLLDATTSSGRTAAAYVISILLATLSKYLVEDPVRFRAAWARGRSGAFAFAGLMIALALLWIVLPAPDPPTIDITDLG